MKYLELILPTNERLSFNLGDSPDFLSEIEEPSEIYKSDEHTDYFIYDKHGCSFAFEEDKLRVVFIYKKFCGSFSLLSKNYFSNFDKEEFVTYLRNVGFVKYPKKYPFSMDMLNDKYRIRYYERPDNSYIMIDSGKKLRELLPNE